MIPLSRHGLSLAVALFLASACDSQATAAHSAANTATQGSVPGGMGAHCVMHNAEASTRVRSAVASAVPALTLTAQDGAPTPSPPWTALIGWWS